MPRVTRAATRRRVSSVAVALALVSRPADNCDQINAAIVAEIISRIIPRYLLRTYSITFSDVARRSAPRNSKSLCNFNFIHNLVTPSEVTRRGRTRVFRVLVYLYIFRYPVRFCRLKISSFVRNRRRVCSQVERTVVGQTHPVEEVYPTRRNIVDVARREGPLC